MLHKSKMNYNLIIEFIENGKLNPYMCTIQESDFITHPVISHIEVVKQLLEINKQHYIKKDNNVIYELLCGCNNVCDKFIITFSKLLTDDVSKQKTNDVIIPLSYGSCIPYKSNMSEIYSKNISNSVCIMLSSSYINNLMYVHLFFDDYTFHEMLLNFDNDEIMTNQEKMSIIFETCKSLFYNKTNIEINNFPNINVKIKSNLYKVSTSLKILCDSLMDVHYLFNNNTIDALKQIYKDEEMYVKQYYVDSMKNLLFINKK